MSVVYVDEDEEYVGKARIYQRYRIRGLLGQSTISAVQQKPLPFVSPEDEQAMVDRLVSRRNDELDVLRQHRLREVATQEAAALESVLAPASQQRHPGFEEFLARHEDLAKLVVRLFHTDIPNPKQVIQFRAFRVLNPDPDIFLFNAQRPLVDAFLKRLVTGNSTRLDISYPQLDLQSLAKQGTSLIRGGSFSIDGRPNLTTVMVYGPSVNEDDSWEEYSRIGKLTYVHLQLTFETTEVKMMVTRRGGMMPYGIDDIDEELRLCREVYDKFLKQFEAGEQPIGKPRTRR